MTAPFRSLGLPEALVAVLDELGFDRLTEVQAQCIPPLLAGRDLVGQSKTGSGKTAAFVLPLLHRLTLSPLRLQALVLCPTRELCVQVAREARTLGRRLPGLRVLEVAGGQPARPQVEALARGVHVVVGTPGRVRDLLSRGALPTESIGLLVLDEADRMLEMGFEREVRQVLAAVPPARQTVLFSATFPSSIEALAAHLTRTPVRVTVTEPVEDAPDVEQRFYLAEPDRKLAVLLATLRAHAHRGAIVFCNFKSSAAALEGSLRAAGISAEALHGDLEQFDRDRVMAKFRNGSTRVLVATDVAARGLDVEHVDLVVNHELPSQAEVYVHRIGRTGRAGRKGLAVSLVGPRDLPKLASIAPGHVATPPAVDATPATPAATVAASTQAPAPATAGADRAVERVTLRIGGGRKEKVRKGDVLGALTGEAGGLSASDVGTIEVHDHFTYVAVSAGVATAALRGLEQGRIKGRRFRVSRVD